MIVVVSAPGAGGNFLAALLGKHYNTGNICHYDHVLNEYIFDRNNFIGGDGKNTRYYWNYSNWNIVENVKTIDDNTLPKIVNYHSLIFNHRTTDFKLYKSSNGEIGRNPNKVRDNTKECIIVTLDTDKDFEFTLKLSHIKTTGVKGVIFDDGPSYDRINVRYRCHLEDIIKLASNKFSYVEWINIWKNFCIFCKKFPYYPAVAVYSLFYLEEWLLDNLSWDLFDEKRFMNKIKSVNTNVSKTFNDDFINKNKREQKIEIKELKKLQKRNGMVLHEINYSDLFFNNKTTNTPLDNYTNEIKKYTQVNIKLIEDFESIYGKFL